MFLLILAVRSILSQLKGLPSMARLSGFEEDDGEELAVGEALQPDVEEEPAVALVGGMAALEREGDRGGDEVDDEEAEEVDDAAFRSWRRRRLRGGSDGRRSSGRCRRGT